MARRIKKRERLLSAKRNREVDFSVYEYSDGGVPGGMESFGFRSVAELLEKASKGEVECEGFVHGIARGKDGSHSHTRRYLTGPEFREAVKLGSRVFKNSKLRESLIRFKEGSIDAFGRDLDDTFTNQVQQDFVPALGGPFYKQLYQVDYLKMHNLCFYASNHDPAARFIIDTIKDFTLGRGYEIQCENEKALLLWKSFETANKLQQQMEYIAREATIYGEIMIWKLPNHQSKIRFNIPENQIPKGIIPRVRLIDPSCIWEIVTIPEDVNEPLYYVWLAPTQWQTYTGMKGDKTPTSKFIFQSIDAKEILHYKLNCASNEKRGRSSLFPILGYLKRLRDAVNYSLLSHMKQSAWSIDTSIEGGQADLDNYMSDMAALGTVPNAGSEFVHTSKVTRQYLAPNAGSQSQTETFSWCLSMISMGTGIPVSYLGTHLSGGQTRASALVSTEPTAKKFEMRQDLYRRILKDLWDYVMEYYNMGEIKCDIILPEIASQDRSAKLKDLSIAESQQWISKRTAAEIAAKELSIEKYDYEEELEQINLDGSADSSTVNPLTDPLGNGKSPISKLTSEEKKKVSDNYGY